MKPEIEATAGEWGYVQCHCIVNIQTGGVTVSRDCDACGNTNLRFIHVLEHMDDEGRYLEVGIECASMLLAPSDADIPRLAENETKRKERWRVHYHQPGRCFTTPDQLSEKGKL
jgi:hypothetical protein